MKAKFIYEQIRDILKPKSEEEIRRKWSLKFGTSYELFKRTEEELKNLNVNVKINFNGYLDVKGFIIFRANSFVIRVLTKEDANYVIESLKKVNYRKDKFEIQEENINLSFNEARNYIIKKLYNIKDYPETGEKRMW